MDVVGNISHRLAPLVPGMLNHLEMCFRNDNLYSCCELKT